MELKSLSLVRVLGLLLLSLPAVAHAQYPGQEVEPPYAKIRAQYNSMMFKEVSVVLGSWRESLNRRDSTAVVGLIEEDALVSLADGVIARDRRQAMENLLRPGRAILGYITTPFDFTASGNLAYVFGRVGYTMVGPAALRREVRGTFTMVLFLRGNRWRVRAYIEREGEID